MLEQRREKQRRLELLGRPRYQCDQCPASFIKGDNFKVHMQMHAGDKPFVCEECGASFVEARYYKWHCASHKVPSTGPYHGGGGILFLAIFHVLVETTFGLLVVVVVQI